MSRNFLSFSFPETIKKQIDAMPTARAQNKFFMAVTDYGMYGIEPEGLGGWEAVVWISMKDLLDSGRINREEKAAAGKSGGRPQTEGGVREQIISALDGGMPQKEVAERYGVSQSTVSRILRQGSAQISQPLFKTSSPYSKAKSKSKGKNKSKSELNNGLNNELNNEPGDMNDSVEVLGAAGVQVGEQDIQRILDNSLDIQNMQNNSLDMQNMQDDSLHIQNNSLDIQDIKADALDVLDNPPVMYGGSADGAGRTFGGGGSALPVPLAHSLSPALPAGKETPADGLPDVLFSLFTASLLPCSGSGRDGFLRGDFTSGMDWLRSRPEYAGLEDSDIAQACRNYVSVLEDPGTYVTNRYGFASFVRTKNFASYLPGNFNPGNFASWGGGGSKGNTAFSPSDPFEGKATPVTCRSCGGSLRRRNLGGGQLFLTCECGQFSEWSRDARRWVWSGTG